MVERAETEAAFRVKELLRKASLEEQNQRGDTQSIARRG